MGRRKEPADTRNRKILRTAALLERNLSYETIRKNLNIGKDLIGTVKKVMTEQKLTSTDLSAMSEKELTSLFTDKTIKDPAAAESIYEEPDYDHLEKELMKPGVTRQLLWEEYQMDCQLRGKIPYQLTQFKVRLNRHIKEQPYASLIIHKPGVLTEVDWTGDKAHWTDPDTGEAVYGWLFVGVLSFSGLTYAEVFADMKEASWIKAHTNMLEYFHGFTPTLRCDNLKTGITKHSLNGEYVLQEDYKGLSSYYGFVVVPGLPLTPKHKPLAENTVKNCEQRLLAALRNEQCYSLEEYNRKLAEKLESFNNKQFQKKNGSRRTVYEEYEKDTLCSLPIRAYEYCEQAAATIMSDGFISFDKNYYSVPDRKPGVKVSVYAYADRIDIYDGLEKLTSHPRALRGSWKRVYDSSHFRNTSNGEWNKERFLRWAESIGPNTYETVSGIFKSGPEQVYYSSVHSLLKLTDKYPKLRVENACGLALRKVQRPSYRLIKSILNHNQDLQSNIPLSDNEKPKRQEYSYLGDEYAKKQNS